MRGYPCWSQAKCPNTQYKEETSQARRLELEGKYQMMCEREYVYWMGKPKNGSMDPADAKAQFWVEFEKKDAITDIWERKKTLEAKDRENRKATTEDVEKAFGRLSRGHTMLEDENQEAFIDVAKRLHGARVVADIDGAEAGGAFIGIPVWGPTKVWPPV